MAEQNFKMSDIKGLTPAVEPMRSNELFALSGRNYVFDALGPKSAFGNRLLLPQRIGKPAHTQGIEINIRGINRCFTFTSDSILEWDEISGGWKVIYLIPDSENSPFRWTWGYLNGYLYFCHPRTGILVYNIDSQICVPHNKIGIGTPEQAISIAVNNGFLTVMTPTVFAWSSPSNGLDFTPALGGAGAQVISDRVAGYPIILTSFTSGCFVWTTEGVMRSEFTGDSAVFRHSALKTQYRPINSFCALKLDDATVVILDERGLFQTKGEAPTPFTPIFNEFILQYIQQNQLNINTNIRLEWDALQTRLYVLTSLSVYDPKFELSFVLYPNIDKWGQFNESIYGMLPIRIESSQRAQRYFGFVDGEGYVKIWMETGTREVAPKNRDERRDSNLFYPKIQKPALYTEGTLGTILSATGTVNTVDSASTGSVAGFYPYDGVTPKAPILTGLDAKLIFGFLRVLENQSSDMMGEVTQIAVRSTAADKTYVGNGYNFDPVGGLDLNQTENPVTTRLEDTSYVNHNMRIIGTIDGDTVFTDGVPVLSGFTKSVRYYSCSVTGIWHSIELRADAIGESFAPTMFEITATAAGRLN